MVALERGYRGIPIYGLGAHSFSLLLVWNECRRTDHPMTHDHFTICSHCTSFLSHLKDCACGGNNLTYIICGYCKEEMAYERAEELRNC